MLKRVSVMLLSLVVCMSMMPAMAFADAPDSGGGTTEEPTMKTVSINLAGENTDNEDYLIKDDSIWLKKRNVQYVLEGKTDKQLNFWGLTPAEENMKPVYISLKDDTVLETGFNIGIVPTTVVLEIPDGTESTVSKIAAVDLTIKGNGTLNSNYVSVNQYKSKPEWQKLRITDTTVKVNPAEGGKSSSNDWRGTCVLDGSADVTLVSNSDNPPLKVGQGTGPHSLTLSGNAKLQCLQANMDDPASGAVDGLELFGDTTSLTLEGSSYLKAQGRDSTGEYLGAAIMSYGDVIVKDSATLETAGYGDVICTSGSFVMEGGNVSSESKNGAGVWSDSINIKNASVKCTSDNGLAMGSWGDISITDSNVVTESENSNGISSKQSVSIDNSKIKTKGKYPAIYGETGLTVSGSTVDAEGTDDCAMYSPADLTINDSTVKAKVPDGQKGIFSRGKATVTGSWIETSGGEKFEDAISNSVLFNGKSGIVIGDFVLKDDVKVDSDMSLRIPENATLTVPEGKTFTNAGEIRIEGTFKLQNGSGKCENGHTGGTATTTKRAKCVICGEEYGDLLPEPEPPYIPPYVPPVEKPDIQVNDGGKTELSDDGTTLTITPDENKEIDKVLLNGENLGAVTEVKNLKTGDKVEVVFKDKVVEPTKEELDEKIRGLVNDLSKKLKMTRTSKKSRRIAVLGDVSEIKDMGYTVKYTFYKKGPKDKKYRAIRTTTNNRYKFLKLKTGTNRFKVMIRVYDNEGKLIASKMTEIKTAKVKK